MTLDLLPQRPSEFSYDRCLTFVRAGQTSEHLKWLKLAQNTHRFKLGVSTWEDLPDLYDSSDINHFCERGKWESIFDFLDATPEVFDQFDYFWFPDDDIETTVPDIERLFYRTWEYDLHLTTPSLSSDSWITSEITLKNQQFILRWSNCVEVMMPVISSAFLKRIYKQFQNRRYGWGMDHWWNLWADVPIKQVAIIDDVTMKHTRRTHSGGIYSTGTDPKQDAKEEAEYYYSFYAQHGHTPAQQRVFAGVRFDREIIDQPKELEVELTRGWGYLWGHQFGQTLHPVVVRRLKWGNRAAFLGKIFSNSTASTERVTLMPPAYPGAGHT